MKLLYQNTRSHRVRFLQIVLWLSALGLPALMYGEVQAGVPDAGLFLIIMTPVLGLFALGLEVYLHCYVVRLARMPDGLELQTLTTFGRNARIVPWKDVRMGRDLHDRFISGAGPSVNNTSTLLHITGRRLPLIIDTTEDALKR